MVKLGMVNHPDRLKCAKVLIDAGALVTAEHVDAAVRRDDCFLLEYFLEMGAPLGEVVYFVAERGSVRMMELVLDNISELPDTILAYAARRTDSADMVRFLLAHGARDAPGALRVALQCGAYECTSVLIDAGTDPTATSTRRSPRR